MLTRASGRLQRGVAAAAARGLASGVPAEPRVFLDVKVGDAAPQRMQFRLFKSTVPITAENFRALCTGEKGKGQRGKPLHFKGSVFHRIIPQFMAQGGDFTHGNGTGGESIYGARFRDENFTLKHDRRGLLSMANAGPHSNGSQFFITFAAAPWLDNAHVVFGELTDGLSVLKAIEAVGSRQGTPSKSVVIVDSGELPAEDDKAAAPSAATP